MRFQAFALTSLLALSALAMPPADKDGWMHTGDGVRTKSVAFITVKVYAIGHDIKCNVAHSKQAVIDADCDKRFTWRMQRDVDKEKLHNAIREAYKMNGFNDEGRINQALAAFTTEFKENSYATITYDAAKKTTTFWQQNGGTSSLTGVDFMKATWAIWFGKIDQPSLGDALISKI